MKKYLVFMIIACLGLQIHGQVPEKFNYQGVLRNSSSDLIVNTDITIQISLLEGSSTTTASYTEQKQIIENQNSEQEDFKIELMSLNEKIPNSNKNSTKS